MENIPQFKFTSNAYYFFSRFEIELKIKKILSRRCYRFEFLGFESNKTVCDSGNQGNQYLLIFDMYLKTYR